MRSSHHRVTQQARQLTWTLPDEPKSRLYLIRDRDAKFTARCDAVFATGGVEVIRTPYRTPKANAFAERWIRRARAEVLDRVLILNETHLRRVINAYIDQDKQARPHQGIDQRCPIPIEGGRRTGAVQRRDVLGGVLHEYDREAA